MATAKELPIDRGASALEMADTIFGEGVTVVSASYTGDSNSSGIYTNGDSVAPGVTPADSGVMFSTGDLRDFTNRRGDPNTSGSTSDNTSGPNNEAGFNDLAGASTYDASYIDVDVIPDGDTISLQFVFSSEEYPEYVGSVFNDIVGIWVNGQPAQLQIGEGEVSVGALNGTSTENLYIDNTGDAYNTEMDGFTATLTVKMPVTSGVVNSVRIGIADVADSSYDSTVLIAANSGQSALIANDDVINVAPNETSTIDVLANDAGPGGATLTITHINGIAVSAGDSVTLTTGQIVTLNPDGTLAVQADSDIESVNFSYTAGIGTGGGTSDTAFVTINSIPCFVAGTRIETAQGLVNVEDLVPGDLVLTHDDGFQPVRWVGSRVVKAEGIFAPILIASGTFGDHKELMLSPQHRILIRDAMAELLFGEPEVLVSAKDLVNDLTVRPMPGGEVRYVHVLFDDHQVIYSEGLATESFLPGPHITRSLERDILDEIVALFPELDPDTGAGYSSAARRLLRAFEARLLINREVAA